MAAVHGRVEAQEGKGHHDHWSDALDDALAQASDLGHKRGVPFEVELHFWAEIEVTNPGHILAYNVQMTDRSPTG